MKLLPLMCLTTTLLAPALCAKPEAVITPDRADALYQCGETATFTVKVRDSDDDRLLTEGKLTVALGVQHGKTLIHREVDLSKENPITLSGTLEEPGFLLATAQGLPETPPSLAGAGFDPAKIAMANPLPPDFREFWEEGRRAVAAIPDSPVRYEKLDAFSNDTYTTYAVAARVLYDEEIYGFLSIPNGPGPYPVRVTVPGAGAGISDPPVEWASRGVMALSMNVHKYPVAPGDAEETMRLYKEYAKKVNYRIDQIGDKERYHFRNAILGIDRMISEVASRKEWDRKHLVIEGTSQGGAMSLIMAGFNPHITAAAPNVPALCDLNGGAAGRTAGWPQPANFGPEALATSVYYDAANFARSIRCPIQISVGFIDQTCPPASIYAAINQIPGPKEVLNFPRLPHAIIPAYTALKDPWVKAQLGLTQAGQ